MTFEVVNPHATGVSPTRSAKILDVASSRTIDTGMTRSPPAGDWFGHK